MARWSFYYGGQLLVEGVNDKARSELETAISEVLTAGNTAWFTASNPTGDGAFSIYLQPGVAFTFVSDDAVVDDLEDPNDPTVVFGRRHL